MVFPFFSCRKQNARATKLVRGHPEIVVFFVSVCQTHVYLRAQWRKQRQQAVNVIQK
jgi:hypothetical protein